MIAQLVRFGLCVSALIAVAVVVPDVRWPALVGLGMGMLVAALFTYHAARYRLPTEGWAHWFNRIMTPRTGKGWKYYYCLLDCQHYAQIRSSRAPRREEVVWCPAHHRTHAEQTRVALVGSHAGHRVRTVTGVALDADLLEDWSK